LLAGVDGATLPVLEPHELLAGVDGATLPVLKPHELLAGAESTTLPAITFSSVVCNFKVEQPCPPLLHCFTIVGKMVLESTPRGMSGLEKFL